jgi:hypothetical protein
LVYLVYFFLMRTAPTLLRLLFLCGCFISLATAQRSPGKSNDTDIVVPAGSKITVEFKYGQHREPQTYDAKVVWPVRIGFTTAIPVGANAKLEVWTNYNDAGAVDMATLTSVTVEGKQYPLQSDALELQPGSAGELRFTLATELTIKR